MSGRLVAALVLALAVIAGAIAIPLALGGDDESGPVAYMGAAQGGPNDGQEPVPNDLSDVQTFDLGAQHTTEDVDYPQTPPAGGEHDPIWLECGAYDEPVRDENAVHALEHGTVWITYDAEQLSDDDVDELESVLPDEGILSPYDGLPAPVVVTVWETQLQLTGADDPRLEQFIDEYGDGGTSPEPMASCHGGVERFASEGTDSV